MAFILSLFTFMVLCMRRPARDRTYGTALILETIILALWIPPTYTISLSIASSPHAPKSSIATLVFCILNLYVLPSRPPIEQR